MSTTPTASSRTVSPLARRVAIYAAAATADLRDDDVPGLTGRDMAALGLDLLDRRHPEDAHQVARIVRTEMAVSL